MSFPDSIIIHPLRKPPNAQVRVPGSKSITNRALVLAALSCQEHPCLISGALRSEDTEMMMAALRSLGFSIEAREDCVLALSRPLSDRVIPAKRADLFVGNSGTTMRFITAMVALGEGHYRLDGVERMRERPIEDLLNALRQLGVSTYCERGNGCPPVIVEGSGLRGGEVRIKGDISSQFLSGLLMVAPVATGDITVQVDGPLVSVPYVTMTLEMMGRCGVVVQHQGHHTFRVRSKTRYFVSHLDVESDASAASYFFGAAAITGGKVSVGISMQYQDHGPLQGDFQFVDLLEKMGCTIKRRGYDVQVHGGPLRGIDVDMNAISDTVMTLAAVACLAEGPTMIRNVAHIRHKETDRLSALATELRRVGAEVEEFADGLKITPRPLHGAEIETYNDHRMAMSMALIGLRVPGIVIKNPACVAKTYPRFFEDLERLRC